MIFIYNTNGNAPNVRCYDDTVPFWDHNTPQNIPMLAVPIELPSLYVDIKQFLNIRMDRSPQYDKP
jgi:hypothetical protein